MLHTPGHAPGAVCLYAPELGTVFTGDTLFHGGPGATGRSFSHFPTIIDSIRERLLTLPPETVVRVYKRQRRPDHHRRRGPGPAGVDRPRALTRIRTQGVGPGGRPPGPATYHRGHGP